MAKAQILLLAGMPRSGSTWMLRLLNELWVARGAQDYTALRTQYHLEKHMTGGSALIELSLPRLLPILRPLLAGHSFAVKTHACPSGQTLGFISDLLLRGLSASRRLCTIYLYRDPRDAVLSGFEYGQRSLQIGKPNAFAETFKTIEVGIDWMDEYLQTCWPYWQRFPNTLVMRYEDLLTDFTTESERLLRHLGLDSASEQVQAILEKYQPGATPQVGTHFHKGMIGRFRHVFTLGQQVLCDTRYSQYLINMGYTQGERSD